MSYQSKGLGRTSGYVICHGLFHGNDALQLDQIEACKTCALRGLDRAYGDLAGAAVFLGVVSDLLAFDETTHTSPLESGRMDEHVLAAVVRGDEAEALLVVVELNRALVHEHAFQSLESK